jgi:hypothetical protein
MTALRGVGMIESPRIGVFKAHEAIAPYLRVKHHSTIGELAIAGDEPCIGIALIRAYADQDPMTIWDIRGAGLIPFIGNGAITAGDNVSSAAAGKVQTGSGGVQFIGKAMSTIAGDNEQVMVLPDPGLAGSMARSSLVQQDLQPYPIPNEAWYLFDSTIHAPLGATALSADDLIYTLGTLGTTAPTITGTDFGGSSATQKARVRVTLPVEYVAGETITLRASAGTLTTVADTSSTIDFNVYRQAAPTVDICATAAQSINALAVANKDFTLTPTNCVPGDVLDILMTYAGVDAGNLGVILPTIAGVTLLLDIKG